MTYFSERRYYGKHKEIVEVPNLVELQLRSYEDFLQMKVPSISRDEKGLEAIIGRVFPIKSFPDGSITLEYKQYELAKPRYTPDECRRLKRTYGAPFKIRVRLNRPDETYIEEDVYLGEIPLMIGGGEFIINGAERVIVSQLHRSPGIDFAEEKHSGEKHLQTCWIIPERGSWIEINVTKKDTLSIRIDQSGKIPITIFIRALAPEYSTDESIIRLFHKVQNVTLKGNRSYRNIIGKVLAAPIKKENEEGEVEFHLPAGTLITDDLSDQLQEFAVSSAAVIKDAKLDSLILNTLEEDPTSDIKRNLEKDVDGYQAALARIFSRLRPGTPFNLERAKELFDEKFHNATRYCLGKVGRFRLNRKFGHVVDSNEMTLANDDLFNAVRYIFKLRSGEGEIDDIDHLGNRRVRTITELAGDEFHKGFLKLKRTIQDRMNVDPEDGDDLTPKNLINSKTISSAIDYFFGRGELSQVVDQTNPLAQITHERRLSALGPGGLNRKRAGFEVRDVHISHYGRICPIETPEGTNIGLISSLSIYTTIDEYGFLVSPYQVIKDGKVSKEIRYLRADEETGKVMAPADSPVKKDGAFIDDTVMARIDGDYRFLSGEEIDYCDVSPKQLVGVSASLIPFLEHNDANRALMGSNMQRQAVPLLVTEPPVVATGMEQVVASNSSMVICAEFDGFVKIATADHVIIQKDDSDEEAFYEMRKFVGLNERTCLNQKPIISTGERVKRGQVLADGAATSHGELALGRNVLVGFMPWDGYNFEDAIIVSEKLVKEDYYTSLHIDEFEIEIRETKLGREEFTRDIPNVSDRALLHLDESGIVKVGTIVKPNDLLVGKVAPKSKSELSPEEKLLHAIFGRAGEDVKNDSLDVPSGVEGIVIGTRKFARKQSLTEEERARNKKEIERLEEKHFEVFSNALETMYEKIKEVLGEEPLDETGKAISWSTKHNITQLRGLKEKLHINNLKIDDPNVKEKVAFVVKEYSDIITESEDQKNKESHYLQSGDELPTGVLEMVKVYIATKRILSVGDKMAGRHGNKGVISKIMPEEDMPHLADGTPVEILLNPLGVPSRMNVGQILETHLGRAAMKLGFQAITPVFDGCSETLIEDALEEAGLPRDGTSRLYDGRTGDPFDQKVTVGYIYMLKLHHLVDDKVHARATGPYSLITQQPLGGKARFGGQRFGEMEVWALEAYGVANILQELLTVKSDDVEGRTKIYESMVKGENTLEPGTPISFEVLTNEIKGLALDIQLHKKKNKKLKNF